MFLRAKNESKPEPIRFLFDEGGRSVCLSANESDKTLALAARAYLLENGMNKSVILFKMAAIKIAVGDVIRVGAPLFNIPKEPNMDKFVVMSVVYEFDAIGAFVEVEAVRWD